MNLNDLHPGESVAFERGRARWKWARDLRTWLDGLRGRSYLYTHVRTLLKTYFTTQGVREDGHFAYELFPDQVPLRRHASH